MSCIKHILETDKEVKVRQAALTVLKLLFKGLSQDTIQVSHEWVSERGHVNIPWLFFLWVLLCMLDISVDWSKAQNFVSTNISSLHCGLCTYLHHSARKTFKPKLQKKYLQINFNNYNIMFVTLRYVCRCKASITLKH